MSLLHRTGQRTTLSAALLAITWGFGSAQAQQSPAPNETGYTSSQNLRSFLATGGGEESRPTVLGRLEWTKARFGTIPADFSQKMIAELQRQRSTYPQLAPGATPPVGAPAWTSIGPTRANKTQNDIKLSVTDSGRLRNILPHPTDANTLYVLSSSGGLWKTTNFESPYPDWVPVTERSSPPAVAPQRWGATPTRCTTAPATPSMAFRSSVARC